MKESNSLNKRIKPEELIQKFSKHIELANFKFKISGVNPFHLELTKRNKSIYVRIFLKNISPAYFNNEDVTRIQIARMTSFRDIKQNREVCIPVGYDSRNESYVIWNPYIFINRINEKENISIYSRKSKQEEVKNYDYLPFILKNEETVFAVNSDYISNFIFDIDSYFRVSENILQPDFTDNTRIDVKELRKIILKIIAIKGKLKKRKLNKILAENGILMTNSQLGKFIYHKMTDVLIQNTKYEWSIKELSGITVSQTAPDTCENIDTNFIIGEEYKKAEIYKIVNVPLEEQGGKWRNGYCKQNNQWFIFANIDRSGKGFGDIEFDYPNKINGQGDLEWVAKNGSLIHHNSIQELKKSSPYLFVRKLSTEDDKWEYFGSGRCKEIKDVSPVYFKWSVNTKTVNEENILISEINEFIIQKDYIGAVLYCLNNKKNSYPKRGIKEWKQELKPYFEEIL